MNENASSQENVVSTINNKLSLLALGVSDGLGIIMLYVVPLVLGAIVEGFGASDGTAGIVVALEFGTMAVAGMIVSSKITKLNTRLLARIAVIVVLLGNILSIMCLSNNLFEVFVAIRMVVGLGSGALLSLAYGLAATTKNTRKTYSFLAGTEVVVAFLGLTFAGIAMEKLGASGAFIALAGLTLVLMPIFFWFPKNECSAVEVADSGKGRFSVDIKLLLVAAMFFYLALNTVYPFVELIGLEIGIPFATIATILTLSLLFSIGGPIICNFLGKKFGSAVQVIGGTLVMMVAFIVVVYATSMYWYAGSVIMQSVSILYFIPLFNNLIARFDQSGRATSLNAALLAIGTAVAPFVSGIVLNAGGSFVILGWMSFVFLSLIIVFAIKPALKADRSLTDTD